MSKDKNLMVRVSLMLYARLRQAVQGSDRYKTMSAQDGDTFWITMGPFFASRDLRLEHGSPVEDDGYTWIVALDDGVVGFAALDPAAKVRHVHVLPERRNQGIAHELMRRIVDTAKEHELETLEGVASPAAVGVFGDCGFKTVKMRGRYNVMEVTL